MQSVSYTHLIEKLHQKELPSLFQEACGRAFDPPCLEMISGELYLTCSEKAPFTMRTGASQRTCGESALCGDTFETFRDGRGRQILLISDGMGTGCLLYTSRLTVQKKYDRRGKHRSEPAKGQIVPKCGERANTGSLSGRTAKENGGTHEK